MYARRFIGRTDDKARVWVEMKFDEPTGRLSISGEGISRGRREVDFCGQIIDDVRRVVNFRGTGWTAADRDSLVEIWDQWHLNDMRAGCAHQRAEGWGEAQLADGRYAVHVYYAGYAEERERAGNLAYHRVDEEHPDGVLMKPCPTCGYRFGSEWLSEDVPADVRAELDRLASLGSEG